LTLKPLTCNPKQLTLIPSDPRLELIIYNWELSKKSPKALKLENPITEPIHNVQTNPEKTLLYIQSRNGDLFLYDIKKQELTNPTKNFKDTYWNPLPDKRLLSLAALQTGTELTIYNNINQQDKESEKTAYKLETPVDFISASPSPNLKNFALIDTNGELWIYQINR
jgi:WD40 repeat protein